MSSSAPPFEEMRATREVSVTCEAIPSEKEVGVLSEFESQLPYALALVWVVGFVEYLNVPQPRILHISTDLIVTFRPAEVQLALKSILLRARLKLISAAYALFTSDTVDLSRLTCVLA